MLKNLIVKKAYAQITNPAIGELGADADAAAEGATFVSYFLRVWNAIIAVGAFLVIIYFLWGALSWITAGGEASKISAAREKMVQAVLGLIVLVASFAIIGFISVLFFGEDFSILNLQFGA